MKKYSSKIRLKSFCFRRIEYEILFLRNYQIWKKFNQGLVQYLKNFLRVTHPIQNDDYAKKQYKH